MSKKEESSACDQPTKSAARERAGIPYKGKSAGRRKEVEESKGK